MPLSRASSTMFRQSAKGTSISHSCSTSASVPTRSFASPTATTASAGSHSNMSRATRSSSDSGMNERTPGVSTIESVSPPRRNLPRVISTVVPG